MRRVSKRLLSTVVPLQICAFVASALLEPTRWLFIPSRDDIIGRHPCWDGAERAIASKGQDGWGDEVVPLLPRTLAQKRERDGGGRTSSLSRDKSPQHRQKRCVDWTLTLAELQRKRQRGGDTL